MKPLKTKMRLWQKKPDRERLAKTYRKILAQGLDSGTLSLPMLESDGNVLGVLANFLDPAKKSISFFVSSRDPDIRDIPVGLMMHADAIRRAIETGYETYDMLRGDEPYKLQLGATLTEISYPVLRRRSAISSKDILSPVNEPQLVAEINRLKDIGDEDTRRIAKRQLRRLSRADIAD